MVRAFSLRYDQTIFDLFNLYTKEGRTSIVQDLLFETVEQDIVSVGHSLFITTCDNNVVHIYNGVDTSPRRMTIKQKMINITSYYWNCWITIWKCQNHARVPCLRPYKNLWRWHSMSNVSPLATNQGGCSMLISSSRSPCINTFLMSNWNKFHWWISVMEKRSQIDVILATWEKV